MSKTYSKLLSLAAIGVILNHASIPSASTVPQQPSTNQVIVEGTNASLNEVGEWEVTVNTEQGTIKTRQLSGVPGIKVAAILGPNSGVTAPQSAATVYNNTSLITTGGKTFASASMQFTITNNTGATLGKPTANGVTGVKLMLTPFSITECPTGATTLARPICVGSNTSNVGGVGASGRNNGTDPVYLAYMTPRSGSNLNVADDTNPPEWNEATAWASATDYARTIWQPNLIINSGQQATFGLRFRYAQNAIGLNQPRVTNYKYKFRVLANRTNGTAITPTNAYVTTVAGTNQGFAEGTGSAARFIFPSGVAVSPDGTKLYVADSINARIRQIVAATGAVTTVAGSGSPGFSDNTTGTAAQFNYPTGVAVSPDGNKLYVADTENNCIRQIDMTTNTNAVTTVAGSGNGGFSDSTPGTAAQFRFPQGVVVSPDGTNIYVGDTNNNRIRLIQATEGD